MYSSMLVSAKEWTHDIEKNKGKNSKYLSCLLCMNCTSCDQMVNEENLCLQKYSS